MSERIKAIVESVRKGLNQLGNRVGSGVQGVAANPSLRQQGLRIAVYAGVAYGIYAAGAWVVAHPPYQTVPRGEIGVRINQLTGGAAVFRDGGALVLPGLHQLHSYPMRDQTYRPKGKDEAPFQSLDGLSLGVDITVRYALDPTKIVAISKNLPDDIGGEVVDPAVQGLIYKTFTRYTMKEIFSTKRGEIQQSIETELRPKLAADGILLRNVQIGKVQLPPEYKAGMEALLAEEMHTEKMRYTLELKEKLVKQSELEAEAEKVRRDKAAEAAANEQVIAAKAQEEAMKHVLPFKQKQIEQRALEAEAEKQSRVKTAEGTAQARVIEAEGEAKSRQRLADAEIYRMEKIGKTTSEQMARDGELVTKHPLLIQKAMADKLSDKIQVIIAPPPAAGGFIGNALLGATAPKQVAAAPSDAPAEGEAGSAQ